MGAEGDQSGPLPRSWKNTLLTRWFRGTLRGWGTAQCGGQAVQDLPVSVSWDRHPPPRQGGWEAPGGQGRAGLGAFSRLQVKPCPRTHCPASRPILASAATLLTQAKGAPAARHPHPDKGSCSPPPVGPSPPFPPLHCLHPVQAARHPPPACARHRWHLTHLPQTPLMWPQVEPRGPHPSLPLSLLCTTGHCSWREARPDALSPGLDHDEGAARQS